MKLPHLVEMNHSPRFWRLVDRLCPNVRRAKNWLDSHGTELHRYGFAKRAAAGGCPGERQAACTALDPDHVRA